jgi:hypothetical protein
VLPSIQVTLQRPNRVPSARHPHQPPDATLNTLPSVPCPGGTRAASSNLPTHAPCTGSERCFGHPPSPSCYPFESLRCQRPTTQLHLQLVCYRKAVIGYVEPHPLSRFQHIACVHSATPSQAYGVLQRKEIKKGLDQMWCNYAVSWTVCGRCPGKRYALRVSVIHLMSESDIESGVVRCGLRLNNLRVQLPFREPRPGQW